MALWSQFIGGSYVARSPVMAADQAINVYLETRQDPGGAKQSWYYGTPGQKWFAEVTAAAGNRGWFTQDGQTWTVIADTLYEVDVAGQTLTSRGTITNDGLGCFFASNGQGGNQLGIVGGGELKVLNLTTNVLSAAIALPFSDPVMLVFQDGYGLINQKDTPIVWFSNLENLTMWDALDFFARSGTSDNIVGLAVTHDRILVLGSKTTTYYADTGDTDNPFAPYPGTTMQVALVSPYLLGLYNDLVCFVGTSARGLRRVVLMGDSSPNDISTPPIEQFLAECPTLEDGEMLVYEQEGHPFVAITAPSSPREVQTYVYDLREKLWHARAGWNSTTGMYTRWRARGVTSANGKILVGSAYDGNVYELDLNTYDDDGEVLPAERTAPYLGSDNQWVFLDEAELGIQAGCGLSSGQGSDPQVELLISRDGAHTWVSAGFATLGQIGDYFARAIWRRLGRARADRLVLKIRQTDPTKRVWGPGMWLRFSPSTGQL